MHRDFGLTLYISSFPYEERFLSKDKSNVSQLNLSNPIYYIGATSSQVVNAGGFQSESKELSFTLCISSRI